MGFHDENFGRLHDSSYSPTPVISGFSLRKTSPVEVLGSGAKKSSNVGKARVMDVLKWLPIEALERTADQYIRGVIIGGHEPENWKKGIPSERFLDSALRHLHQYLKGDRVEDHLAACVFNVFGIMYNDSKEKTDAPTPATN